MTLAFTTVKCLTKLWVKKYSVRIAYVAVAAW